METIIFGFFESIIFLFCLFWVLGCSVAAVKDEGGGSEGFAFFLGIFAIVSLMSIGGHMQQIMSSQEKKPEAVQATIEEPEKGAEK